MAGCAPSSPGPHNAVGCGGRAAQGLARRAVRGTHAASQAPAPGPPPASACAPRSWSSSLPSAVPGAHVDRLANLNLDQCEPGRGGEDQSLHDSGAGPRRVWAVTGPVSDQSGRGLGEVLDIGTDPGDTETLLRIGPRAVRASRTWRVEGKLSLHHNPAPVELHECGSGEWGARKSCNLAGSN